MPGWFRVSVGVLTLVLSFEAAFGQGQTADDRAAEPLLSAVMPTDMDFKVERPAAMIAQDDPWEPAAPQAGVEAGDSTESSDLELPGLWDGFLTGGKGFDDFVHPVSSPLYFHDPFIDTRLNFFYLWHEFPDGSALKGGDLSVWAMQIYVALTERLQLTATSDGYSRIRARALQPDEGWNDLAAGLKYNVYANPEDQFTFSAGLSWKLSNGHAKTLHGGVDELNPYLTAAKGWGKFRMIGTIGGRLPMDDNKGNYILYENLHLDYELFDNFYPLLELHGLQYLSNGNRLPLDVGGLDYANIGSNDVRGNSTFWGGVGFRWKLHKNVELGATYGFPISDPDNDIFGQRTTVSLIIGL